LFAALAGRNGPNNSARSIDSRKYREQHCSLNCQEETAGTVLFKPTPDRNSANRGVGSIGSKELREQCCSGEWRPERANGGQEQRGLKIPMGIF
jgi:hypothetical protein